MTCYNIPLHCKLMECIITCGPTPVLPVTEPPEFLTWYATTQYRIVFNVVNPTNTTKFLHSTVAGSGVMAAQSVFHFSLYSLGHRFNLHHLDYPGKYSALLQKYSNTLHQYPSLYITRCSLLQQSDLEQQTMYKPANNKLTFLMSGQSQKLENFKHIFNREFQPKYRCSFFRC